MKKEEQLVPTRPVQRIEDQILQLKGRPPVMLTKDLAEVYQVTAKQVTQAVRRNPDRFPEDFVFELTHEEISGLQNEARLSTQATEKILAFTREGANMLSACLKSKIAAERAVQIMRAFSSIERSIDEGALTRIANLEKRLSQLEHTPRKSLPPGPSPEKLLDLKLASFLRGREFVSIETILRDCLHIYGMESRDLKLRDKVEQSLRRIGYYRLTS